MNKKDIIIILIASSIGGVIAINANKFFDSKKQQNYQPIKKKEPAVEYVAIKSNAIPQNALDFTKAAIMATNSVVYIRSTYDSKINTNRYFRTQKIIPPQSSGSGVIISSNGYIVTNNHVIKDATTIQVILNDNRSYVATLIGSDPTTDLALIKIEEEELPFMVYGNSDQVRVGQWVLAVGNPFNLTSTVTAGIISAKARNIGILRDENSLQVESFLQTDAVINSGNSGGALLDINGKLVGINSAIESPTGSYTGYAFAIPVNLVKKVIDDLLEFGIVQRALLGIQVNDMSAELAMSKNLSILQGVYISKVNKSSAADEAGIERHDVIVALNDIEVTNTSRLQELVARHRPGDKVKVKLIRKGKTLEIETILKSTKGTTTVLSKN